MNPPLVVEVIDHQTGEVTHVAWEALRVWLNPQGLTRPLLQRRHEGVIQTLRTQGSLYYQRRYYLSLRYLNPNPEGG